MGEDVVNVGQRPVSAAAVPAYPIMYDMDEPSNEPEAPEAPEAADDQASGVPEEGSSEEGSSDGGDAEAESSEAGATEAAGTDRVRAIQSVLVTLLLAAIVFVLIYTSFQNYQVEGTSMSPNVEDGQFIIVNKAAYRRFSFQPISDWFFFLDRDKDGYVEPFGEPQRGEVVVFKRDADPGRNFIKRVIGMPGETIEVCGQGNAASDLCRGAPPGSVFIDGVRLDEHYLPRLGNRGVPSTYIQPGHYFVFGDERVGSYDSRAWGMLPRGNIIGKAWFSYFPFDEVGIVTSHDPIP